MVEKNSDTKELDSDEEFGFDAGAQNSIWEDSLGQKSSSKASETENNKSAKSESGFDNFLAGLVDEYRDFFKTGSGKKDLNTSKSADNSESEKAGSGKAESTKADSEKADSRKADSRKAESDKDKELTSSGTRERSTETEKERASGAATARSLSMLGDALVSVANFAQNPAGTLSNAYARVDKGGFKNLEVNNGVVEEVSTPVGRFKRDGTDANGADKYVKIAADSNDESGEKFDGQISVKDGKVVVQDNVTGKSSEFAPTATRYSDLSLTQDGKVDHMESEGRSYRYIGNSDGKDQYLVTTPQDQEGKILNGTVSVSNGKVTVADEDRGIKETYHSEASAKAETYEQTRKFTVETTRAIVGSYVADSVDAAFKDPSKIKQWYADSNKSIGESKPGKNAEQVIEAKPTPNSDAAKAEAKGPGAAEAAKSPAANEVAKGPGASETAKPENRITENKIDGGEKPDRISSESKINPLSEPSKSDSSKPNLFAEPKQDAATIKADTSAIIASPTESKNAFNENKIDAGFVAKTEAGEGKNIGNLELRADSTKALDSSTKTLASIANSVEANRLSGPDGAAVPNITATKEQSLPSPRVVADYSTAPADTRGLESSPSQNRNQVDSATRVSDQRSDDKLISSTARQISDSVSEKETAKAADQRTIEKAQTEKVQFDIERKASESRNQLEAAASLVNLSKLSSESRSVEAAVKAGLIANQANLERNSLSARILDASIPQAKSLIESGSKVPAEAANKMLPQPLGAKEQSSINLSNGKSIESQIFRSEISATRADISSSNKQSENKTAAIESNKTTADIAKSNTPNSIANLVNALNAGRPDGTRSADGIRNTESTRSVEGSRADSGTRTADAARSQGLAGVNNGRNESIITGNRNANEIGTRMSADGRVTNGAEQGLRVDPTSGRLVRTVDIGGRSTTSDATALALTTQTRHTTEGRYMIAEVTLAVVLAAGGIRRVLPTDKSSNGGNSGANNETRKLIERELSRLKEPATSGLKFVATSFKLGANYLGGDARQRLNSQSQLDSLKANLRIETLKDGRRIQLASNARTEFLNAFRATRAEHAPKQQVESKTKQMQELPQSVQLSFGILQPRLIPLAADAMSANNFAMPANANSLDRLFQTQKRAMGEALRPLLGSQDFIVMDDPFQTFRDALAAKKAQGSGDKSIYGKDSNDGEAGDEEKSIVLLRPSWLISAGETLVSLAEEHYNDPYIGWLIADLNAGNCKEHFMDGKRIVEFNSRQKITLPVWQDIVEFYGKMSEKVKPENLITIVSDTEVDREVVDSVLGPILAKQSFRKATIPE